MARNGPRSREVHGIHACVGEVVAREFVMADGKAGSGLRRLTIESLSSSPCKTARGIVIFASLV